MRRRRNKKSFVKNKKNKKDQKLELFEVFCFNKEVRSEKHYRELIMSLCAWRNEKTDLIGNCSSYQERFFQVKDVTDGK